MSEIDLFRHELCGLLAGVPVYHLQEVTRSRVGFDAGVHDLLLGGGSGEHPAAVINATRAAVTVLDEYADLLDRATAGDPTTVQNEYVLGIAEHIGITAADLGDLSVQLERFAGTGPAADFSEWGSTEWVNATKAAKRWPFGHPYRAQEHGRLENWLTQSLGEYALVSYPELVTTAPGCPHLGEVFTRACELSRTMPLLATVAQHPTGYQMGGRGEQLNDRNMRH